MALDRSKLPASQRCTAKTQSGRGPRCTNPKQAGLEVCHQHGGRTKAARAKTARFKAEAVILKTGYGQKMVDDDHPGSNPVSGLVWELRSTAGNIVFLREKIADLSDEELIWGRTLEETKDSDVKVSRYVDTDPSYNLTKDEARINLWAGLLLKERVHYKDLIKLALAAGFEDRRIRMQEEQVLQINNVLANIISALGRDPEDPEIRRLVRNELVALTAE